MKYTSLDSFGFFLGLSCGVLAAINLAIANTGFALAYFLFLAIVSIFILLYLPIKPVTIFILILGFPEYGANPYNEVFLSPFYFQKYILLFLCLKLFFIKFYYSTLFYLFLVALSFLISILYGINGALLNEMVQLLILISLLNIKFDNTAEARLVSFLLSFIAFSFISSFILEIFGVFALRPGGGKVFFFGHWFGILTGYFIIKITTVRYPLTVMIWLISSFVISIYVNINTLQSSHFVWFLVCFLILMAPTKMISSRSFLLGAILITGFFVFRSSALINFDIPEEFLWVIKKVQQISSLFAFDVMELSNSPLIRLNQALALVEQSNFLQLIFGRGYASTYELAGAFWDSSQLHDATFPIDQLNSGLLQMVHETIILLFKWTGIFGLLFVWSILIKRFRAAALDRSTIFYNFALAALFLLSGVHTGILCLFLIKYSWRANAE